MPAQPDTSGQLPPAPGMSGQWLSVNEAVAYCAQRGLNRNIKTIRRWAERSMKRPDDAEVKVREQDTGFGFRYMIERRSLDVKIKQELDFEAAKDEADTAGQVRTDPDMPEHVRDESAPHVDPTDASDMPGHDHTGPDTPARKLEVQSTGDTFLKDQIGEKDRQIERLNAQLERKDEQIMTMLERDRETNILIRGLQDTVANILRLGPPSSHDMSPGADVADGPIETGDNPGPADERPGV